MIYDRNFEKLYDPFYTGRNRKEIFHLYCSFIEAMRSDDYARLDEICTENCELHISTIGHVYGVENMKQAMKWPGPAVDISRASIWNFTVRSHGDRAVQYAYVQCTRAIEDEKDVYAFQYGFRFSNCLIKEENRWKFSIIRADLCYSSGNDLFVYGKWNLIDHFKFTGHETMINAEMDNPWFFEDDEPQSDDEAVFELVYRFTYAFDMNDYHFMNTFTTDDFVLNEGPVNLKPGDQPLPGDRIDKREIYDFLRYKWYKEAQMMHSYRPVSITYEGNTAEATLYRGEDHRLKNRILNKDNIHDMVMNMICTCGARKENGVWKMTKYRLEMAEDAIRTADDCLVFDEYVRDRYGKPEADMR